MTRPRPRLLALGGKVQVAGRQTEIVRRSGTDEKPLLRLDGFDGREAAERLRGEDLLVAREDAPKLESDEWLVEDLEGLKVVDGAREIGAVKRVLAYPSCDLLEVAAGGRDVLVPLISDAVRAVDIDAGRVDVDFTFLGEDQ